MMGVDDVVAQLELDVLDLARLEVLEQFRFDCFRNGDPPWGVVRGCPRVASTARSSRYVCR
jgi:hypothetical protein